MEASKFTDVQKAFVIKQGEEGRLKLLSEPFANGPNGKMFRAMGDSINATAPWDYAIVREWMHR